MEPMPLNKEVVELVNVVFITISTLYLTHALIKNLCTRRDNTELLDAIEDMKDTLLYAITNLDRNGTVCESESDHNMETFESESNDSEDESEQDKEKQDKEKQDKEKEQVKTEEIDKHAILRQKLKENQQVFVSYKKTTFVAIYETKISAPHGYVFKYNNEEYVTPSQLSFKLKRSLNPNIISDNGWDTVYINDANDDKKKHTLKSLTLTT